MEKNFLEEFISRALENDEIKYRQKSYYNCTFRRIMKILLLVQKSNNFTSETLL